ncbi:hypothetical protein BHE74_00037752 [Ensete ventricosum]|nr:hypothetical protein GW17_00041584 [Ensete ventricosum]RWW55597.1 hypothetical protein BHE74_00037752 [Ensete ventricosum]RZS16591.1 hypothetical protein BHM03_00048605 [Ensete ventricosum]
MVPQWWVFRVRTSNLALDENLGHQHMGVVYHRGRISSVSASESHGGLDLIENRIGASPATRWRRPCMRVTVRLSIDQGKFLREHRGVEVGGRKGRGSDDESRGFSDTQKQSFGQKGGGLRRVPRCRRGGSIDCEERDPDARQRIVGHGLSSVMIP